jgi:copper chaperone CopZ
MAAGRKLSYHVEGIVCAACAEDMERLLGDVEGVTEARVNYMEGTLELTYDPEAIDERAVYAATRKLGFRIRKK